MTLVFKKDRMLARVKDSLQDMSEEDVAEVMALMDNLDGLEALPNRWRQTVYGEVDAYYCKLDGRQIPVNRVDCEYVSE